MASDKPKEQVKEYRARILKTAQDALHKSNTDMLEARRHVQTVLHTVDAERKAKKSEISARERMGASLDVANLKTQQFGTVDRRLLVDWGGGLAGSVVYQGLTIAADRLLGPAPGEEAEGWLEANSNWFYPLIVSAVSGVGYGVELGKRPHLDKDGLPYLPGRGREVTSEAFKIISQLGLNHCLRIGIDFMFFGKNPQVLRSNAVSY